MHKNHSHVSNAFLHLQVLSKIDKYCIYEPPRPFATVSFKYEEPHNAKIPLHTPNQYK